MRSPNAESVEEAVEQLKEAESRFLYALKGMGPIYTTEEIWENFRLHCQQLSGWIEHGRGVTKDMWPVLTKILYASEKILLEHREYDLRKRR
jgi:hypothetical protein